MTKQEFIQLMGALKTVFPNFKIDERQLQAIWWEKFEPLRFDFAKIAVNKYTSEERFAPTPADILNRYKEIENLNKSRLRDLKEIYESCHSWFSTCQWSDDDWAVFKEKIKSEKFADCLFKSEMIKRKVLNHKGSVCGETFAEFVKGVEL